MKINTNKLYYTNIMLELMTKAIKEKKSYTMSNQLLNDVFDELGIIIE